MEPLSILVTECVVDWRENEQRATRIIEFGIEGFGVVPRNYEFVKGGYNYLDKNEWVVNPINLTQGSTVALQNHPDWKYAQRTLTYTKASQRSPLTPEFQRELYEELYRVVTPESLKQLFLGNYQPATDVNVEARLKAKYCFVWSDAIRACGDAEISGQFQKKIDDDEYALHGLTRHHDYVALFVEGNLRSLEPRLHFVGYPAGIMLKFADDVSQSRRREIWDEVQAFQLVYALGPTSYYIRNGLMIPDGPINGLDMLYPHSNETEQNNLVNKLQRIRSRFRMQLTPEGTCILS